jgi:radical SAM superfamily enzyme YgiQ (UPF0313 family)|tara:strand:- start:2054 stop:3769 length:1716 start_codon:yes stop_codon:yes gene_type:complete
MYHILLMEFQAVGEPIGEPVNEPVNKLLAGRIMSAMKVLLINPYYPLTEMPSPPLGLAYVAAAFERAGAEVQVLDLVVESYCRNKLERLLMTFQPELVGATCVTMSFDAAVKVLNDAKEARPEITTLLGGPHVSYRAKETLEECPALDIAVLGEGEVTVAELMTAFGANGLDADLSGIAGLAFRQGSSVCITTARPHLQDVNRLAEPARKMLPMGRYRALGLAVSMITSRGCPFQCIFCVGRKMSGAKVRYRDPVAVVDELAHLHALGFKQINIADDLFTAKKKHCFAICDEIIARGIDVRWTAFSRANTISPELLARLKRAGCVQLSFGFESANEDILKTVQKRIDRETMLAAVEMCQAAGMSAQASFIYGLPGESQQTMRETAEFSRRINAMGTTAGIHLLAPFPGTLVREHADRYRLRILTDDWSQYTANTAIVETPDADRHSLERDVKALQDLVLQQFEDIRNRVEAGVATEEEVDRYQDLDRLGIYYELMMQDLLDRSYPTKCVTDPTCVLTEMVDRVAEQVSYPPDRIRAVLNHGLEQCFFAYTVGKNSVRWFWKEPIAARGGAT